MRHLEAKVSENQDAIHQLRREREKLEDDREKLQDKVSQMSKVRAAVNAQPTSRAAETGILQQMDTLRQQLSLAQTTQDQARHQLDVHAEEIQELRSFIVDSKPLPDRKLTQHHQRAVKTSKVHNETAANSDQMASALSTADSKLRELRQDVERCLKELNDLRTERDMLRARLDDERVASDRAHSQLQLLRERLEQSEQNPVKGKGRAVNQDDHLCCAG